MKINYNMPAYVANASLLRNENALTASLEKLSSGYRINHASDDPAGMALSAKMRTQIKGLEQASRNASDGSSVISTAEGALQEVTSMIQRMRELAVQAGNDTNTIEDRDAIQKEIDALKEEVNRISTDTEFNKMPLLDGSLCSRVYANTRDVSRVTVSKSVEIDDYELTVTEDAKRAVMTAKPADPTLAAYQNAGGQVEIPEGQISINGVVVRFKGGESEEEVYTALRDACELAEVNLVAYDSATYDPTDLDSYKEHIETEGYIQDTNGFHFGTSALAFVSEYTGSNEQVSIECSDDFFAGFFGLNKELTTELGSDVKVELGEPFSKQATVLTYGNKVSITDRNDFEMTFDIKDGSRLVDDGTGNIVAQNLDVTLQVTDIGNMDLQVGANEYQTIAIDIPCISSEALRIDTIDVRTIFGPDKALIALDEALARVTAVRSDLGAAENRLDHAIANLDETDENMNAAISRIQDVDMAAEMSTYTQMNVLVQAATSVLAQANDLPEQTLQLIQ